MLHDILLSLSDLIVLILFCDRICCIIYRSINFFFDLWVYNVPIYDLLFLNGFIFVFPIQLCSPGSEPPHYPQLLILNL